MYVTLFRFLLVKHILCIDHYYGLLCVGLLYKVALKYFSLNSCNIKQYDKFKMRSYRISQIT